MATSRVGDFFKEMFPPLQESKLRPDKQAGAPLQTLCSLALPGNLWQRRQWQRRVILLGPPLRYNLDFVE